MEKLRSRLYRLTTNERGFTLVELLMVMVIIGVLAGLGFTGFNALQTRSSRTQADVYWRDLNSASQMFRIEKGGHPTELSQLGGASGYIDTDVKPWLGAADRTAEPVEGQPLGKPNTPLGQGVEYAFGSNFVCVWVNGVSSGLNPDGENQCPAGPGD